MTVIANIWRGELPQFTVWNAIYGKDVGHASMLVINDENPEDTIYISHRPQTTDSGNSQGKFNNKDTSKQYALEDSFTPKAEWISFDEDCKNRKRKPDSQINISGLNESKIREFYQRYFNNDLPEFESQYHVRKNNCSAVIAYFIREGLGCSKKPCYFCLAETNQPDYKRQILFLILVCVLGIFDRYIIPLIIPRIFDLTSAIIILIVRISIIIILFIVSVFMYFNIEIWILNFDFKNKFWSPRTLEYFAKQVKKDVNKKCQRKNSYFSL
ncbi:MAG: hypothetical protein F6K40_20045 [Okeania sp. SIO3I5]|uniref:hypothetical protein n=1 Tax=Okeania sp. SIO3I5 TaxID=2607805 RepID=UPI0013BC6FC3|nr:hypothetical protein [Okeania sp. SIO3I5]NEQ38433.1 hypothetical protein [Okeania sp. SIO3I5]